jgi:ORF6N domain.
MDEKKIIPDKAIEQRILMIRGQKVMLSTELAELYGVEPKVLLEVVKRNIERFPDDFMFQLTNQEVANLKSQIVTSSWGDLQPPTPYAFTEQGVAMLSRVLRRKRAVQVDIEFKEVFDAIRQLKTPPESSRKKIGFKVKEKGAVYKMKKGGRKGSILQ